MSGSRDKWRYVGPVDRKFIPERWGWIDIISEDEDLGCAVAVVFIKAGHVSSVARFFNGTLIAHCSSGNAVAECLMGDKPLRSTIDRMTRTVGIQLLAGHGITISKDTWHSFRAIQDTTLFVTFAGAASAECEERDNWEELVEEEDNEEEGTGADPKVEDGSA